MRSRDGQRVGKMRVDVLAKYFEDLTPKPSKSHDHLYQKIWSPTDYPEISAAHQHSEECSHDKKPEEEKQA